MKPLVLKQLIGLTALSTLMVGCSLLDDDDTNTPQSTYQVTVTNLTANQPLSPLGLVLHSSSVRAWQLGTAASAALENLAESGDNSGLLALSGPGVYGTEGGVGVIPPGASETVSITINRHSQVDLTLATMLVNTNDAFAGQGGWDISALSAGESLSAALPVYDAGTEANSESAGTIPGPADGGEGFNAARDDFDYVARHPGVVTQDDGYGASVLDQSHRFDGPVASIRVTRVN